jgi:hypothetical protein
MISFPGPVYEYACHVGKRAVSRRDVADRGGPRPRPLRHAGHQVNRSYPRESSRRVEQESGCDTILATSIHSIGRAYCFFFSSGPRSWIQVLGSTNSSFFTTP